MKYFLLILLVSVFSIGCGGTRDTTENTEDPYSTPEWQNEQLIWMEMEPVQCLGNAWQKFWINKEGRTADDYPVGDPRTVEAAEKEIIIDYFASLGIDIVRVDSQPFPADRMVCEACTCPQGYTLFVRVLKSDAPQLADLGFKRSERL